jgi:hypothetical protein
MIGNEETKKTAHSLTTSCNNGFFIDIIYILMYVNFKEWKKCVNKYYINHDKKRSYIFFHFLPLPSTNQKE